MAASYEGDPAFLANEPFRGCFKKMQEMGERAESLMWLYEKHQRGDDENTSVTVAPQDKYGDFAFTMSALHTPESVSYNRKTIHSISGVRLFFFWIVMQSCYGTNESISLDEIARRLPNTPKDSDLRKYQSEINAAIKKVIGIGHPFIVASGSDGPRHLQIRH